MIAAPVLGAIIRAGWPIGIAIVERLRGTYRGNKSLEALMQLQIIPLKVPGIRRYFVKIGIAAEIGGMGSVVEVRPSDNNEV